MSFNLFPILALQTIDNLLFTPYRNAGSSNFSCSHRAACWHSHQVTPLENQLSDQVPGKMQKTSLKVHDVRFSWKANQGSPSELHDYINELESREYYRCHQRPNMLADIKTARFLVSKVSATFDEVKSFESKLIKYRNELRLQSQTDDIQKKLIMIKELLSKISEITLPKVLTEASVEIYKKNAHEILSECESQFVMCDQQVVSDEIRSDIEKSDVQGTTILGSINNEIKLNPSEEIPEISMEVEQEFPEEPIGPELDAKEPVVSDAAPEVEVETSTDEETLSNSLNCILQGVHEQFENLFEELKKDFPDVKNVYGDMINICNEQFASLKESIDPISTLKQYLVCLENIKHFDAALGLITDLIKSEEKNIKTSPANLPSAAFIAKYLMQKMSEFTPDSPLYVIYDVALNIVLDADKRHNDQVFENVNINESFLHESGFTNLAHIYSTYIHKAKDANAIFKKGDSLETFQHYCEEWDKACEILPFEKGELTELLANLRVAEEESAAILSQAQEKAVEWRNNHQLILEQQLSKLINSDERNQRKADLTFDVNAINDFISFSRELSQKISQLSNTEDMSLINVITFYENSNPDFASVVRKHYAFQLKKEILDFVKLIESSAMNDSTKKISDKACTLMTGMEIDTGFFGMNKKRVAVEELSTENLQKFAIDMKQKLEQYKAEYKQLAG